MSFCEKCGKQLAEGEVCSCQATEKKKGNPAIIVLAILAIAIVALVVVFVINSAGGSSKKKDDKEEKSSYMDPIDNYLAVVNKKSVDVIAYEKSMLPDFAAKKYSNVMEIIKESDDYADDFDDYSDDLKDYYDDCDDEFEGWKLSFKKEEAEKMDEDDLEDYKDYVEEYYEDNLEYMVNLLEDALEDEDEIEDYADDFDLSEEDTKRLLDAMMSYCKAYEELKVSAGYEVTGKFVLKSDGETYETDDMSFVVLKVNGSWVYWGLTDYSYLGFDDDDDRVFNFFFSQLRSSKLYKNINL